jgi:hypothetical protein
VVKFTIRDLLMATVLQLQRSFNSVKGQRDELLDTVRQFHRAMSVPASSP